MLRRIANLALKEYIQLVRDRTDDGLHHTVAHRPTGVVGAGCRA